MDGRAGADRLAGHAPKAVRVLLVGSGIGLVVLAALSMILGIEGARGPTRLVSQIGFIWEGIFAVLTVALTVGMLWISTALRSVAAWVLAALSGLALLAAAVVALLRMAGAVDVLFPLANWVPGTVCLAFWGWAAGRASVRHGRLPPRMGGAAGLLAILQVLALALAIAVFAVSEGRNVVLNLTAGIIVPAVMAGMGVWWILLGVLWRGVARTPATGRPRFVDG
jgi:hypothetical protein